MSKRRIVAMLIWGGAFAGSAQAQEQTVWKFDNLSHIGGMTPKVEGAPKLVDSPVGKALQFNGKDTAVVFPSRPLVGAKTFTVEAIFRPEGGEGSQRLLHISTKDPKTGLDTQPNPNAEHHVNDETPRIMLETRGTKAGQWFLHAYMRSKAGLKTLNSTKILHPYNAWYTVEETYDGKTFRSYVNGVLEGEGDVAFDPQGPGRVAVGSRLDRVAFFKDSFLKGSMAEVRFTTHALKPDEFLKVPSK
jgi:hypothetical protein